MAAGLPPKIGPFEPVELLATGGMARVVVANHTDGGPARRVALKLILPELADDDDYTTMFIDEARLNSHVQHPNVVRVLDVGRDPETKILYMAMELVLGATLSRLVSTHRALPLAVALEIVAQAADGLDAAHRATTIEGQPFRIVHRDVSPQNLLVGLDERVRVSDFGVAHAAHRLTKTRTGQFKGKISYCSPEQILGRPVDWRADIFALGIVAYELITQTSLFTGSPSDVLNAIVGTEIPPILGIRADVPAEITGLVHAALAQDPASRPQHVVEIARTLRRVAKEHGLVAPEGTLRDLVADAADERVRALAGLGPPRTPSMAPVDEPADEPTRVERPRRNSSTSIEQTIVDALVDPAPDPDS